MVRIMNRTTLMYAVPLPLIVASVFIGPSDNVTPSHIWAWLSDTIFNLRMSYGYDRELVQAVVLSTRLPRILLAFLVGASLTASGTTFQALFRNPLVSPDILGLSSGAAFGASLALIIPWLPLQPVVFFFGVSAVGLCYWLALKNREASSVSLILSGIIVSSVFTAALTIVQFLSDPFRLQTIVHWTMGNLHTASWAKVRTSAIPIVFGCAWLFVMRWRMNLVALGEEETRAVGIDPRMAKLLLIIPATLITTASVAVSGIIGMVGLAVPHMIRMLVGPDNTRCLPASFALGGSFLLIVDDLSRAIASFELPIGIFTTIIGGPFFIYLFKKGRGIYPGE